MILGGHWERIEKSHRPEWAEGPSEQPEKEEPGEDPKVHLG